MSGKKEKEYEYIIVGSGVAGATIASRLLDFNHNTSILILEAGPFVKARDRRHWWDFVVLGIRPYSHGADRVNKRDSQEPTESDVIVDFDKSNPESIYWDFNDNRISAYGGSTLHWGGWSLRFKPEDFELASRTGVAKTPVKERIGADWPIKYNDLEPYYCEAEDHLSVCGCDEEDREWGIPRTRRYPIQPFPWTQADDEMKKAFEKCNIVPGHMPLARYKKCMTTGTCKYCPLGSRYTAQTILDDLRSDVRNVNLDVRWECPVNKIIVKSKKRISGVEYINRKTERQETVYCKTAIICSGAYESPKLLMNSLDNQYWPDGIGNDHDLVGRFVVSHSMLKARGRSTEGNAEKWIQEYDFPTLMSRTYDKPENQETTGKMFIFKDRTLPHTDIANFMQQGNDKDKIKGLILEKPVMELQAFVEEKGRWSSRISSADGTTRVGLRKTKICFTRSISEQKAMLENLEKLKAVIRAMDYELIEEKTKVEDPGGHHATGTCRMSSSPEEGVVNENLLVHGTDNLYVCSNAAFPTGSAVNPTLTLTALAMRLSDHLLNRTPSKQHLVGASAKQDGR